MKTQHSSHHTRVTTGKITPADPRYNDLAGRGFNKRFAGRPAYIRLVGSVAEVVDAVQEAVNEKLRVVVRSGGHCLEGFVSNPEVRVVIDTSLMSEVYYDATMNAFAVEAGATMGEVYRKLFLGWGVTIPAGESPDIGAGGHILGGAFGFICRGYGLAADYLYGVEIVVVAETGTARSVVATRNPADPNHDLWWGHTGAGGGNFGIVTRYWLRTPGAPGTDPRLLLPAAPESVLVFRVAWNWVDIDQRAFTTLMRNFGIWCERNSDADSPYTGLHSMFSFWRQQYGKVELFGLSTAGAAATQHFEAHLAAVNDNVGAPCTHTLEKCSWLAFATNPFPEFFNPGVDARFKFKDAFLRKPFTDHQMAVAYDYLTRTDHDVVGGSLGLVTYGGMVNTVAQDATAAAQRDAVLSTSCTVGWMDPQVESCMLAWVRAFYRDLYADTGGVPVPGEQCDGAMINHPDTDLADPAWNTSGVPWHTLYYKENYGRLQQIKRRWDPHNIFHHALSIRPV
ncbi:FAD-binding oxidoreductase [Chitinophaga sp. MM2321]|uniref:FAD-binding oxidoreductase n=1 Tax=Chitinophaga sp. MM2321 TaxID=3137178 RepID=UPI0032D597C0